MAYTDDEKRAASAAALSDLLVQKKPGSKYWTCPACGHERVYNPNQGAAGYGKWHCMRCGVTGDAANLLMLREGMAAGEAFTRIMREYGSKANDSGRIRTVMTQSVRTAARDGWAEECADYCRRCANALKGSEGESYLIQRGIDEEMRRRCVLGYDARRNGIVIPYSRKLDYYAVRLLKPYINRDSEKLVKMLLPPTDEAGREPVYNAAALTDAQAVFVVEGQIDALSILQAVRMGRISGVSAVSTCGTVDSDKLVRAADAGRDRCGKLFIAGDNDEAGRKGTDGLALKLDALKIDYVRVDVGLLYGGHKDANERLQCDQEGLIQAIRATVDA